jgi:hypothetical protein
VAVVSRALLVVGLMLILSASLAASGSAASGPQVPTFTLHRIQTGVGDGAYLPTWVPAGYRYERWRYPGGKLIVSFRNRAATDRFTFQVSRLPEDTACDLGGAFHRIIDLDGRSIYYRGEAGEWIAWRCATSPRTRTTYLIEVHSRGPLSDLALARAAASAKRFAR